MTARSTSPAGGATASSSMTAGVASGAGGATAGASGATADAGGAPPTPTAGTGGGSANAGAGGGPASMDMTSEPEEACNPTDKTADPKVYTGWTDTDTPPTGPYKVVIETDPGIASQTIYRPEVNGEIKMPIIVWGEGGCIANGLIMKEFLYDVASHGFLIIADGTVDGGTGMGATGETFKNSITWAVAENDRPCSQYYHKLDTSKIAASGQSCGGLMTYMAADDERLTTIAIFNSGLFSEDPTTLAKVRTPTAYFLGGSSDIAYENGERDYAALAKTAKFPLFNGNNMFGHGGTYNNDNGGECARVGEAWFRWQLMNDETENGKGMFWGKDCGLCKDSQWMVKSVNME
jgi:hypothetical protein